MKQFCVLFLIAILCAMGLNSCSDEAVDVDQVNKQTIFVFMPWSGNDSGSSTGLLTYFKVNLDSIKRAVVANKGMSNSRLMVFISTKPTESTLYEFTYNSSRQKIDSTVVSTYTDNSYTTAEGITSLLNTVKSHAEALNYALIIGCHGSGWTYASDWNNYPYNAKPQYGATQTTSFPWPFTEEYEQKTRFFGSVSSTKNYGIDIETLAQGIEASGTKMQYILFDDCYMSNAEVAYELRNVTNFLIASSSEVMALGMPYYSIWSSLCSATPNYSSVVSGFYNFYSKYYPPCGNLAAIDCREMEDLAAVMKSINSKYTLADSLKDSIQVLDGFEPNLFYDLQSYVEHLNPSQGDLNEFNAALSNAVKSAQSTEYILSALYSREKQIKVNSYCGLSISDISTNPVALRGKEKTSWWQATH